MTELKKLSPQKTPKLTAGDGLQFGFGFWFAGALVMLILIPGFVALIGIILFFLGLTLQSLVPLG